MSTQSDFYRDILQNLSDGAMAVDFQGKITLFNPAAAQIFGVEPDQVVGRKFAEVFMLEIEGSDDFNQVVLDAVYEQKIEAEQTVRIPKANQEELILKVKSSLLQKENGENIGVVVVFTDITQEKKMQEEQKRLNKDLQQAYLELENSNSSLRSALKKVRVVRFVILFGVIIVFSGLGYYTWQKTDISTLVVSGKAEQTTSRKLRTVPVRVRPVDSSISLSGKLEPLEKVNILCPYSGRIQKIFVDFGQRVQKGDTLLKLSSDKLEEEYRNSQSSLIEAQERYQKLVNWEDSPDYNQAKRRLSKARHQEERAQSKLKEANLLFDNGIISKNELQRAKDELRNAKNSLVEAKENMQSIKDKADAQKIKIARYKLENAKSKFERVSNKLDKSSIKAKVSGVVLHPILKEDKEYSLEEGSSFKEGEILLTIGNMEGLSIASEVDEVDVQKIEPGQKVKVQGEGFSEINFQGRIDHVSTVAKSSSGMDLTVFPVRVVIPQLTAEQRKKIRLGMTANMQVEVYSNPEAMMVPIDAVSSTPQGHFVRLKDPKKEKIKRIKVKPGITTMSMVEIKTGLQPGDKVVLP
jgi:PAS domain S-box-containing protein